MPNQSATEEPAVLTPPDLRICLLGPPEVEWAGYPLAIPRRQARALLYRLAAHLEPVPREQLCFLFWPDTPESTACRNLSHLLTHLRRALPASEVIQGCLRCLSPVARSKLDEMVAGGQPSDHEREEHADGSAKPNISRRAGVGRLAVWMNCWAACAGKQTIQRC